MDHIIAAVRFLLTGSAFQSTIPPIANAPQPNSQQLTPYHLFQGATQPTIPIAPLNPPPALKTEANTAAHAALLCSWCTEAGHFTHNCANSLEYLNAGKVS